MARLPSLSALLTLLSTTLLLIPTQALYFYIDGTTPKCFYEELPKDTLVVGASPLLSISPPFPPISPN
jgi:hypothetical protein